MQRILRFGLIGGLTALIGGLFFAGAAALLAGDWWLAQEPWIGIGLTLLVIGLATTAVFALVLDAIEPIGRLRLLALPPALIVISPWSLWLVLGVPTTGPGPGPERDIRTILYSLPQMLALLLVATLLIALPLVLRRRTAP